MLQLKAYAKVDAGPAARHKGIPVMVSITAPTKADRSPVDVVAVLNVVHSCKAPANWHELVSVAMGVLIGKLDQNDRLAIVPVHETLLPMSAEGKKVASTAMQSQAIRSDVPLWEAYWGAVQILHARKYEEFSKREGFIILVSNSGDIFKYWITDCYLYPVHAFGFRDARNARAMYNIANKTEGVYAILDDELGRITEAFEFSINKITSVVAVQTEVGLTCSRSSSATLTSIECGQFRSSVHGDNKSGYVIAGDMEAGMVRNFVVYVDNVAGGTDEYGDLPKLFAVSVKYLQAWTRVQETVDGLVFVVCKGMDGSSKLGAEMARAAAVGIVAGVELPEGRVDWKELDAAADEVHERWSGVQNSDLGREAGEAGLISGLAAEMQELETRLRNNSWLEYVLSWLSYQTLQLALPPPFMGKAASPLLRLRVSIPMNPTVDADAGHASAAAIATTTTQRGRGLPLLVRVMAPAAGFVTRAPIDLVAVLDVSTSAGGKEEAARLLGKAMKIVTEKLSDKDRLAIIDSSDTQQAALSDMSEQGRRDISAGIESLVAKLSTASANKETVKTSHWLELLNKAMRPVRRKLISIRVCLPVKSSVPTSQTSAGSGSAKLSKALEDAMEILDGRQGEREDSVGLILLISDNKDSSLSQVTVNPSYNVHAFGLRGEHNARALHHVASRSNGTYAVLNDDGRDGITEAFTACINRITSVVAVRTEVRIALRHSDDAATLSTIESGQFRSSIDDGDNKSGAISAGTLYAGAARNFIVYVDKIRTLLPEQLTGHVKYVMPGCSLMNNSEQCLVNLLAGEDGPEASADVAAEMVRAKAIEMVSDIAQKYDGGGDQRFQAVDELHGQWSRLKDSENARAAGDPRLAVLAREIGGMNAALVRGSGLPYMLSWLSFQNMCEQLPSKTDMDPDEVSAGDGHRQPGLPPLQLKTIQHGRPA